MTESAREQDFLCPVVTAATPCFAASCGLAAACCQVGDGHNPPARGLLRLRGILLWAIGGSWHRRHRCYLARIIVRPSSGTTPEAGGPP